MKESRKVAIARFVLRNKEHLAAIRPMDDVLTLTTMRFHDEVTSPNDLDGEVFDEEKPKKPEARELEMAKQLIESLTSDFKADQYRDEYREELLDLLERKAAGKEVVSAPSEEPKPTKAPDLMSALEESLAAVKRRGGRDRRQGEGEDEAKGEVVLQVEEHVEVEELFELERPEEQHVARRRRPRPSGPACRRGQRSGTRRSRSAAASSS